MGAVSELSCSGGEAPRFLEYSGMSYERASREAARLIERSGWFQSFDRLTTLRGTMLRHMALGTAESR